ncbi:MAG: LCP family protein [Actinobacteria bacterium]|nr:LCP family protein [Actinomycetota bacterium]
MAAPRHTPVLAAFLSMLLPGLGQLALGARRRGALLLGISALLLLALLGAAAWLPGSLSIDRRLVASLVALDLAVLALRLFAVLDAGRTGRAPATRVAVAAIAAVTVMPHVALGYVAVRGYDVLETVFADEEPGDVLTARGLFLAREPVLPRFVGRDTWELSLAERLGPGEARPLERSPQVLTEQQPPAARPWTTILLLGTDEGPGNWGARTDTIILVAAQHGTGRAAAFGVPRNLAQVPVGGRLERFREQLNGLYGFARTKPNLFPGGADAGATALKQAVSRLLGVRVDYYALVNLRGFADLVDALGGVRILVKERLVDSVTRPAWGEPKPRIDVFPDRTYHFYGREALAYVRSRKASSDYTRMARQRCFLSALADQLDPVRVLRNFGSLARTIETSVSTDVPLDRFPGLVRLVTGIDPEETLTVTFGPKYFFGRRKKDNSPVPHAGKMRATVRNAILHPELLQASGKAETAKKSC